MNNRDKLYHKFLELYGGEEGSVRMYHAPGRVNLIGEHTDYNGGYVFPAALTFGTTMLIRKRRDRKVRLASMNFELQKTMMLDEIAYDKADDWANYPKAMLFHLMKKGYSLSGYDVLYDGQIPNGAGLSSSASLQVVSGYGFLHMEGIEIDRKQLALVAQESENQFLGVNCGIMDQFSVAMGKKEHALLLKCNTLEYEYVPAKLDGYSIVISNTNKRRGLIDSEYNARRTQCEQAVIDLQQAIPNLTLLAELTPEQYASHAHLIQLEEVSRRAEHVIYENGRVLESVDALKAGNLELFGQLMNASHASLRDLYEVSCHELNVMVEAAQEQDGVLGSRMTGAGFGGCTVSIVETNKIDSFMKNVGQKYREKTELEATFYTADIGDGVDHII